MRVETIGNATLYLADCLTVLPSIQRADAVITDPPFGVRDEEWDAMDEHQFAAFSMGWLAHARRIAPEMVSFCFGFSTFPKLCEMLYPRVRHMIWHKPLGSQYAGSSEGKLWFSYETILHCHQGEVEAVKPKNLEVARLIKQAREAASLSKGGVDMVVRGKKTGLCYRWEEAACLPTEEQIAKMRTVLQLGPDFDAAMARALSDKEGVLEQRSEMAASKADVFIYPTVANYGHPCEKPIKLLEDLILTVADGKQAILDPFMGVGSTGVACMNLGRKFVGIEENAEYFDVSCQRIENAQRQERLFA
jgi:hypothetical protein